MSLQKRELIEDTDAHDWESGLTEVVIRSHRCNAD